MDKSGEAERVEQERIHAKEEWMQLLTDHALITQGGLLTRATNWGRRIGGGGEAKFRGGTPAPSFGAQT